MSLFNNNQRNTVIVKRIVANENKSISIFYDGKEKEIEWRHWVQVPYLQTREQYQESLYNEIRDYGYHMFARYKNLFEAWFDVHQMEQRFNECWGGLNAEGQPFGFLPYMENEETFNTYFATIEGDWFDRLKPIHADLQSCVECFVASLANVNTPAKLFLHKSPETGKDKKMYFKATNPAKLTTVFRAIKNPEQGPKKWIEIPVGYKDAYRIFYTPKSGNAQFPFQLREHKLDVVGFLADSITNPNGTDSEMWRGECHPSTYTKLLKVAIEKDQPREEVKEQWVADTVPVSNVDSTGKTVESDPW